MQVLVTDLVANPIVFFPQKYLKQGTLFEGSAQSTSNKWVVLYLRFKVLAGNTS